MKYLLLMTNRYKKILLKIFPHKLLKKIKQIVFSKSADGMKRSDIKPFDSEKYPFGVNLIGDIKAETGLGQSCRLLADEIRASGLKFSIYRYAQLGNLKTSDSSWDDYITQELHYCINLVHINPYEFGIAYAQLDKSFWDYRYNIGFWLWELEEFPEEWVPCISCFHEIWTPSEFISNSIRKKTSKPVVTIPYHVNVSIAKEYDREYFHLPKDKFLFLTMYDSASIMERKNPLGTFEAFRKAFSADNHNVGLVIKINNANKLDIKLIQSKLEGYRNIFMITDTLNKDQVNSLIKDCDVLVSLHRAEGFGLVLAEAMLLGTPTIATNWSSNTEFMNSEVACMVDYKLTRLEEDMGPFKKGNCWADPNIEEASEFMKKLYYDSTYYDMLSNRAKAHIEEKLSMQQATELIKKRLSEIWGKG